MEIKELIDYANIVFHYDNEMTIEQANKIIEESFLSCKQENNLLNKEELFSNITNKSLFVKAMITVLLNEFGMDQKDIVLNCNDRDGALASFKAQPDVFGKKTLGTINVNITSIISDSYFEIAKHLFHEFNHFMLYKEYTEGKDIPHGTVSGNGCLMSLFPLQFGVAYMANKNERLSNLKGYYATKKCIQHAEELGADLDKLKSEEKKINKSKLVNDINYVLGNMLLGRVWDKALIKLFEKIVSNLSKHLSNINTLKGGFSEEELDNMINGYSDSKEYISIDKKSEQTDICRKLMQIYMPKLGIGHNEYILSVGETTNEVRIIDFRLNLGYNGMKKNFDLKYDIAIPKKYLELPPREFIERVMSDLDAIVQRKQLLDNKENPVIDDIIG